LTELLAGTPNIFSLTITINQIQNYAINHYTSTII
jgi:hypothetical protein